jgi:Zn-dependent protease
MYINIFLAAFNMMPFCPLDGARSYGQPGIMGAVGLPTIVATLILVFGWTCFTTSSNLTHKVEGHLLALSFSKGF